MRSDFSCVTPAGTSNELDVQNEWEENTHTHTRKQGGEHKVLRAQVRFVQVERVCPLCRV